MINNDITVMIIPIEKSVKKRAKTKPITLKISLKSLYARNAPATTEKDEPKARISTKTNTNATTAKPNLM